MFVDSKTEVTSTLHCMIDIESFGVLETAPIITIGAVLFDPTVMDTFEFLRERALLVKIDIEDAIQVCGPAEGSTLKWWFTQDPAAIQALSEGEKVTVKEGLKALWRYTHSRTLSGTPTWLRPLPIPTNVWANSPGFDMKIINNACRKCNIKNPFFFSTEHDLGTIAKQAFPADEITANELDVRTVKKIGFPNGDAPDFNEGTKHDAADDAVAQALLVQACYQQLGLGRDAAIFHK